MRLRSMARHRVRLCVVFALALAPLVLSTSQPVAPVAVAAPRARAAVSLATMELPVPSRSATRFSLLEQIDPELIMLQVDAVREGKVSGPKGTRVWTPSAMSDHNVPAAADRAYRTAARTMAGVDPYCQLPWTLLAGIGRVESDHGRYGGSTLAMDGVSHPLIIGVQLNGKGPVAAIRDTDNGKLDKDKVWDRAVGPMQFIPSTWVGAARDGDGDGVESPNDLDDAALAAATYLCSGSGSVLGDSAMSAAIHRYNQDDYYVALVKAFERGYRTGVFIMPAPPAPEEDQKSHRSKKKKRAAERDRSRPASNRPTGTKAPGSNTDPAPAPKPSRGTSAPAPKPAPKPKPSPTPTPIGPKLTSVTGTFQSCEAPSGWCLGSTPLDLGTVVLTDNAADDFDANGTTGTNTDEFTGLSAKGEVTLLVEQKSTGVAVVYVIDGMDYRFGDGSLA